MQEFREYVSFRKMIIPRIAEILFWITIFITFFAAIAIIQSVGFLEGLLFIVIAPFIVRFYFEFMVVIFKIHEVLEEIKALLVEKK